MIGNFGDLDRGHELTALFLPARRNAALPSLPRLAITPHTPHPTPSAGVAVGCDGWAGRAAGWVSVISCLCGSSRVRFCRADLWFGRPGSGLVGE